MKPESMRGVCEVFKKKKATDRPMKFSRIVFEKNY